LSVRSETPEIDCEVGFREFLESGVCELHERIFDVPGVPLGQRSASPLRQGGQAHTCMRVPSHSPTTEELLERAEDMMRQDWAYLKDFNAALDQLQKKQEKFEAENPGFGRYS